MKYDFDEIIDRKNTGSVKHDYTTKYFGSEVEFSMWVADMDFRTPDFIMNAIRERAEHEVLGYTIRGDSFYQSIINWYKKRQDWEISKESILFSPGIIAGLNMAIRACSDEGDKIIVQPPVYHPFFSVIRDDKRIPLYNPLLEEDGYYRMDLEGLKEKIDPSVKGILLSHPHNPVGRSWTPDELKALGDICLENGITIISDEVHSDLVFQAHRHVPFSTLGKDLAMNMVTCVAASKTFNLAGLSSSVLVIENEELRSKVNHELSIGHLFMGNIFGSVAMEAAYSKGHEWLDQLMDYLKGNLDFLAGFIDTELPDIRMHPTEATYMAWLNMKGLGLKGKDLRNFMIHEAGIGFNDGPSFGPGGEGYQRINFACPRPHLSNALHQLKDTINKRN